MTSDSTLPTALDESARAAILNTEVAKYARDGWAVQTSGNGQAVLTKQRRMGWFWNTILVLVTGGLWLIYVIYRALNRKSDTLVLTVDQYGKIRKS